MNYFAFFDDVRPEMRLICKSRLWGHINSNSCCHVSPNIWTTERFYGSVYHYCWHKERKIIGFFSFPMELRIDQQADSWVVVSVPTVRIFERARRSIPQLSSALPVLTMRVVQGDSFLESIVAEFQDRPGVCDDQHALPPLLSYHSALQMFCFPPVRLIKGRSLEPLELECVPVNTYWLY